MKEEVVETMVQRSRENVAGDSSVRLGVGQPEVKFRL